MLWAYLLPVEVFRKSVRRTETLEENRETLKKLYAQAGIFIRMKNSFLLLILRDAEMTIKKIFERSSQKGGLAGGSKRGSTGDPS